jgi:hypothetical protein
MTSPSSPRRAPAGACITGAILTVLSITGGALVAMPAQAAAVTQCVAVDRLPGGGARVRNACSQKIEVAVCVTHPKHWWPCGRGGGLIGLLPGADYPVPDLTMWPGEIRYAACTSPESPSGWNGSSEHQAYTCK